MKNTIFTGAGVAIVTPMNADGSINFDALGENIEYQIANGTDAIIICGTTGESATMTDEEHVACIKYAVEKTAKRIPVIAGTGSNDTKYAVDLSKHAEELGADALLVVTPYYNKTSQRGLIAHFTAIADSVNIPIILYNVPSRTGVNIAVDTYVTLSKHKNICGIKEASGSISTVAKIIAACGNDIDVYSGNDDQIVPIMSLGGKGVISVLSNVLPKETHEMAQYCLDNDFEKAAELQLKYLELINNLFIDVNPIPVKEAMNIMGMKAGECRLPLLRMEQAKIDTLTASMKKAGLVK
jgi:4-hydroxy-tetrahydrodipicolinate synthase